MSWWDAGGAHNRQTRMRFARFLNAASWSLATVLLILPLTWLALLVSLGDESHAVFAGAIAPMIGVIGYALTGSAIKRWSK